MGSLDHPFSPVSLALGAEATFVGRALDSDRKGLSEVLRAAAEHPGATIVEILQDCPIFNDGSFDVLLRQGGRRGPGDQRQQGEPVIFGNDGEYCVVRVPASGWTWPRPPTCRPADRGARRDHRTTRPTPSRCRG